MSFPVNLPYPKEIKISEIENELKTLGYLSYPTTDLMLKNPKFKITLILEIDEKIYPGLRNYLKESYKEIMRKQQFKPVSPSGRNLILDLYKGFDNSIEVLDMNDKNIRFALNKLDKYIEDISDEDILLKFTTISIKETNFKIYEFTFAGYIRIILENNIGK